MTDLVARLRDPHYHLAGEVYSTTISSERKQAAAEIERLRTVLIGIAVMDVYTRPGETPASEVMRMAAKEALEKNA